MEYSKVESLQWGNEEKTIINMLVTFKDLGVVPFTAYKDDSESHARELFNRAFEGDFGTIEEMPLDEIKNELKDKAQRDHQYKIEQGYSYKNHTYNYAARFELMNAVADAEVLGDDTIEINSKEGVVTLSLDDVNALRMELTKEQRKLDDELKARYHEISSMTSI